MFRKEESRDLKTKPDSQVCLFLAQIILRHKPAQRKTTIRICLFNCLVVRDLILDRMI